MSKSLGENRRKPIDPPEPEPTKADREIKPRFSIVVRADGRVDWASAHDGSREKLRAIVSDPDLPGQLGIAKPETGGDVLAPELVGVIYDALSVLLAGIAQRSGYSVDQAAGLKFTSDEKETLAGPTAKVVNKYGSKFGPYQDELVLAFVLTTMLSGKLAILRAAPVLGSVTVPVGYTVPTGSTGHGGSQELKQL